MVKRITTILFAALFCGLFSITAVSANDSDPGTNTDGDTGQTSDTGSGGTNQDNDTPGGGSESNDGDSNGGGGGGGGSDSNDGDNNNGSTETERTSDRGTGGATSAASQPSSGRNGSNCRSSYAFDMKPRNRRSRLCSGPITRFLR